LNEKIAIFGAGDLGREILLLIRQINRLVESWDIIGFFDDNENIGTTINGIKVLGGLQDLNVWKGRLHVVFAISDTELKKKLIAKLTNQNITYPVLIHPNVEHHEFQNIKFGKGSIICSGNIFTTDIKIGDHVLINLNCTIGHDCIISDFCSIMPGVNVSGKVKLGEGVYIGTGSQIINYISIGDYTTIGAGATVIDDIQSHAVAVGTPARITKLKKLQ
jgi:sugar O-acyltransferase (sialic acid O-acetyltransferase NeuD family)